MIKEKKKENLIFILIFIVGFLILIYPQVSDFYYRIESNNNISYFDDVKTALTKEETDKRYELAKSYNKSLTKQVLDDPYDDKKVVEGKMAYARMLEIREYIGHIEIPSIHQDIPIFAGTTEEVLQKGAGHLEGTSLPIGGENTHTVITAHTGLPSKKLFTDLNKLTEGDIFYIHNFKEILAYKVNQIKVVEPEDFSDLVVVNNQDYATLLTCTPYMVNTHRLLVRGTRISYNSDEHKSYKSSYSNIFITYILYWIPLIITIIIVAYIIKRRKRHIYEKK